MNKRQAKIEALGIAVAYLERARQAGPEFDMSSEDAVKVERELFLIHENLQRRLERLWRRDA